MDQKSKKVVKKKKKINTNLLANHLIKHKNDGNKKITKNENEIKMGIKNLENYGNNINDKDKDIYKMMKLYLKRLNEFSKIIQFPIYVPRPKQHIIIDSQYIKYDITYSHMKSAYIICNGTVIPLIKDFLAYKLKYGNDMEKKLYKDMKIYSFINRLMTLRPICFLNRGDDYILRNGKAGHGWNNMDLNEYMSYDEIILAALMGISSYVQFINNGNRNNCGYYNKNINEYIPYGIYTGLVGPRFEKKYVMEYSLMVVDNEQNVAQNGYGKQGNINDEKEQKISDYDGNAKKEWFNMFAKWYNVDSIPTFKEVDTMFKNISVMENDNVFMNKLIQLIKKHNNDVLLGILWTVIGDDMDVALYDNNKITKSQFDAYNEEQKMEYMEDKLKIEADMAKMFMNKYNAHQLNDMNSVDDISKKVKQNIILIHKMEDRYVSNSNSNYLDKIMYRKRLTTILEMFLFDCDYRAKCVNKKAYIHIVGLGLGVWALNGYKITQYNIFVDIMKDIILNTDLLNISCINFSHFKGDCIKIFNNKKNINNIDIIFDKRNISDILSGKYIDNLLCGMFAWDGNSFVGNEYYQGMLSASGDPAAASCSTLPYIQNPLINIEYISGKNTTLYLKNKENRTYKRFHLSNEI